MNLQLYEEEKVEKERVKRELEQVKKELREAKAELEKQMRKNEANRVSDTNDKRVCINIDFIDYMCIPLQMSPVLKFLS